jgi:NAD(P)-dependent dehydrogenase (short-subunit alcohol dehydrogenase family)
MQILIIGASRGIGLEFVRQYRAAGADVTATARDETGLSRLRDLGATAGPLDVVNAAVLNLPTDGPPFDVVVLGAGVYGPRTAGLDSPTQADFDHVMHTNVLGAMRVLPQLSTRLAPNARLAVISSAMGSIGQRANASGWLYRASKAALNSVLKDVAVTLGSQAVCVSLHPGWVRTDMGGAGADIDVTLSVGNMRRTLAALTPAQSGGFFNHDGSTLPW